MCGRYTLTSPASLLGEIFEITSMPEILPRYNIAPTQEVAGIRHGPEDESHHFSWFRWGLVPPWAKDASIGTRLINARSETVSEKPSFRDSFRRRRCLLMADGFFEWGKPREPYHFSLASGRPFAIAGLWSTWSGQRQEVIDSCTLLTIDANSTVAPIHHRMPVILPVESWNLCLDPALDEIDPLLDLLRPSSEPMKALAVSSRVNKASNEGPDLLLPAEPEAQGRLF